MKERVFNIGRLCMLTDNDDIEKEFSALLSFFAPPLGKEEDARVLSKAGSGKLREDRVKQSLPTKTILSLAPKTEGDYIVVPGTMEGK